jgi:hypothetical protein
MATPEAKRTGSSAAAIFQAQAASTLQAPSLPDHQKKARMVGMRPEPVLKSPPRLQSGAERVVR